MNNILHFSNIKPGSVEPIETRHLVIHFHLEDETIELAEDHDTNSGRYKAPLFLKRCKIPKVFFSIWLYSSECDMILCKEYQNEQCSYISFLITGCEITSYLAWNAYGPYTVKRGS